MSMKAAAQGAAAKAAEAKKAGEGAEGEYTASTVPPRRVLRVEPVKISAKIGQDRYQKLMEFALEATGEIGYKVTHQAIIDALLADLEVNQNSRARVKNQVAERMAYERRVKEGRTHIGRPRKTPIR